LPGKLADDRFQHVVGVAIAARTFRAAHGDQVERLGLHEAFGEIPGEDESERARAVRALLDDARFVRYAPQLGEYGDKVKDLAARAAEAVRRWA
jgi:hypothetical protein